MQTILLPLCYLYTCTQYIILIIIKNIDIIIYSQKISVVCQCVLLHCTRILYTCSERVSECSAVQYIFCKIFLFLVEFLG